MRELAPPPHSSPPHHIQSHCLLFLLNKTQQAQISSCRQCVCACADFSCLFFLKKKKDVDVKSLYWEWHPEHEEVRACAPVRSCRLEAAFCDVEVPRLPSLNHQEEILLLFFSHHSNVTSAPLPPPHPPRWSCQSAYRQVPIHFSPPFDESDSSTSWDWHLFPHVEDSPLLYNPFKPSRKLC